MIIHAYEGVINCEGCGSKCPGTILSVHYPYVSRIFVFAFQDI